MSDETTSYGTWGSKVDTYSSGPDADVTEYISSGGSDWYTRLKESGAIERIKAEYREAIEKAIPPDISLCGDRFIGPAYPEEGEFNGYPTNGFGALNFKAMIADIDLGAIIDRNDPDQQKDKE